jgi:hypothetical protein
LVRLEELKIEYGPKEENSPNDTDAVDRKFLDELEKIVASSRNKQSSLEVIKRNLAVI